MPIINPDGVAEGNFRTDSLGKNLNRYYTSPDPELQPEIYGIKKFIVSLINSKKIDFCLDTWTNYRKVMYYLKKKNI